MPSRKVPLVNSEIYHIYNRGVEKRPIFTEKRDYSRFILTLRYYQHSTTRIKLSTYLKGPLEQRKIVDTTTNIDVLCYVLMPNHFHLLVQQTANNGISKTLKNISDSYTRYFNIKYERIGPLFQGPFKCVHVEKDEQLLHVSRYIHLNPLTSFLVGSFEELKAYRWSSLSEYLEPNKDGICQIQILNSYFTKPGSFQTFLEDQANYQQQLGTIQHLLIE